jgi:hypothetical protein
MSDSALLEHDDMVEDLPFPPVPIYGYKTIPLHPLHPLFRRHGEEILTAENRKSFVQTAESVLRSVELWGPSIGYVRSKFITYDLCKIAIENHGGSICSIEPHLLTPDEYYALCILSVTKGGYTIDLIPKEVQTQELCDIAINSSCIALKHCLDAFKTYANCFSAVKRNGETLVDVPRAFIDEPMCMAAVKSKYPCLDRIPKEFLTRELCEEAVKANGENIRWVPEEMMSVELGYLAVTSPGPYASCSDMAGSNIQYIPAKYLSKDTIVESARRWYPTYKTVPEECRTDEIEDAVLEVAPICIQYMNQTPQRCLKAIKVCPYTSMRLIKKENITSEMEEIFLALPKPTRKYSTDDDSDDESVGYTAGKRWGDRIPRLIRTEPPVPTYPVHFTESNNFDLN